MNKRLKKDLSWIEILVSIVYAGALGLFWYLGSESIVVAFIVWISFINAQRTRIILEQNYE